MTPDSDTPSRSSNAPDPILDSPPQATGAEPRLTAEDYDCLTVEDVQDALGRSRASIYRYANTTPDTLNPPFDRKRLNPELRKDKDDPLMFHPSEVERFARDILGIQQVTIDVHVSEQTVNQSLLRQILSELTEIRQLLEADRPSTADNANLARDA